jgi:CRISPR-associated protein Cas2
MFIVVCYDIPSNKRRGKVAQALKGFGYRVQRSVFECEVTAEQFQKMKQRVSKRIVPAEDSVRYYTLCGSCLPKIEISGLGEVKREKPFFVI